MGLRNIGLPEPLPAPPPNPHEVIDALYKALVEVYGSAVQTRDFDWYGWHARARHALDLYKSMSKPTPQPQPTPVQLPEHGDVGAAGGTHKETT